MASHKAAFDAGEVERLVILVVVILGMRDTYLISIDNIYLLMFIRIFERDILPMQQIVDNALILYLSQLLEQ